MKASIDVKDRKEADAIRSALDDPAMRALVLVFGALNALDHDDRCRIISYVTDRFVVNSEHLND
jgi:hypothetical protein